MFRFTGMRRFCARSPASSDFDLEYRRRDQLAIESLHPAAPASAGNAAPSALSAAAARNRDGCSIFGRNRHGVERQSRSLRGTLRQSQTQKCVARGILHLIKLWLKAPIIGEDDKGVKRNVGGGKANSKGPLCYLARAPGAVGASCNGTKSAARSRELAPVRRPAADLSSGSRHRLTCRTEKSLGAAQVRESACLALVVGIDCSVTDR